MAPLGDMADMRTEGEEGDAEEENEVDEEEEVIHANS